MLVLYGVVLVQGVRVGVGHVGARFGAGHVGAWLGAARVGASAGRVAGAA